MKPSPARQQKAAARDAGFPHVSAPVVELKALGSDSAPGSFEAIVAAIGNVDHHGDRLVSGVFDRSLKERGYPPLVWTHDWITPPVGVSEEAREMPGEEANEFAGRDLGIEAGLYIKGRLFVDTANDEDHAIARQVWTGMKTNGGDGRPALREFSFGYRTIKSQWVEEDPNTLPADLQWTGGEIRELVDVELWEVGPTLVGANPATALLGVKASVRDLESRGLITSEDASKMLREVGDNPGRNAAEDAPKSAAAEVAEDVRARIDQLRQLLPPETIA